MYLNGKSYAYRYKKIILVELCSLFIGLVLILWNTYYFNTSSYEPISYISILILYLVVISIDLISFYILINKFEKTQIPITLKGGQ